MGQRTRTELSGPLGCFKIYFYRICQYGIIMSLEDKINNDIKEAMKAKDEPRLRSVRSIKAAILLVKTDGSGMELNAEREVQLLQKMLKQRQDSLQIYQDQNRADLALKESQEIEVIQSYLPTPLTDEELTAKISAIITELGATSAKDMGRVIGAASKAIAGQADGKTIAAKVKVLLG